MEFSFLASLCIPTLCHPLSWGEFHLNWSDTSLLTRKLIFRRFADVSLDVYLKTIYLPLSTIHILRLNQLDGAVLYSFIFISSLVLLIHLTTRRFVNLLNVIVVAQFAVAFYYSLNMNADNDNYWLEYFLALFIINHFSLPKLSQIFSIPFSTLSSMSLVFLNLFLINAFSF